MKCNFLCIFVVILGGILIDSAKSAIKILDGEDPGQCDSSNHGDQVLARDPQNNEKILICSKNDDGYQWKTVDGSSSLGELFNPGFDCSDILNKNVEAKDGFYWVQFDSYTPKKVWCDMTTDGGGFMLIGHKNNSVTWTVPSNDDPVEPFGFPHWSSALGDAPIQDFRIQMSTANDFEQTKAHWSFRFNNKRPLKNLMINEEKGCENNLAGIGDIAYVKDLQTEEIVTTTFRCSKFGLGHHPDSKIGWHMMNTCLQKPCPWGFAYHHKYPIQLDHSGAFSYSVTEKVSGIVNNSTAFVGCNSKHCCGCYGPVGGTKNYCSKKCKPINGGTVTTNVYTWFWVRSALPKRAWSKCMEYQVTKDNGDIAWYKLVGGNVNAKEGRCAKDEALLNDGIVVVPDSNIAKKIPPIPGLLAYRKDNKELYLRSNKTWKVIAEEKKVLQEASEMVTPKLNKFEKKLGDQNQQVLNKVDTKFAEINKTLAKQTIKYNSKFDQLDQNLEKQLGNQNRNLTDKLNAFTSIIDRLNKQLQEVRNETLKKKQLYGELYSSVTLKRRQNYLSKLWGWLPSKSPWNLCYRATRDGWAGSTFHSNCNNKGPTVTIVRVGDYVFGGYTDLSWDSSNSYKTTSNSFIFSLKNKDNLAPFKAPVFRNSQYAIYCGSSYGPTFGGHDLHIANNANSNTNSYTYFGHTYQLPSGYSYTSSNTRALLPGSYHFTPSEVEVFYLR